jgi:hypothetical protein
MIEDGCVAFPLVMFGDMPMQLLGIYSTSYETEEVCCIHPIDRRHICLYSSTASAGSDLEESGWKKWDS